MNQLNRSQAPDIDTLYVMSQLAVQFLSFAGVKELLQPFGGDISA